MEPTTYDTPGHLDLQVRVPSGTVFIAASASTTTTLEISGERNPDELSVSLEPGPNGQRLTVERRRTGLFGSLVAKNLNIRVTVPEGTNVRVDGTSIDLVAQGSLGAVAFRTATGDASVENVVGDAEAKVTSGDLKVEHVGGTLSFHSASGDVTVGSVGGSTTARTASGDVKLGTANSDVRITTVSGDIAVATLLPGGSANLQAVSGDIEVGVATGTSVYLDLSSLSGSTKSDLDVSNAPPSTKGSGKAEIKAATVSGDIQVRRSPS